MQDTKFHAPTSVLVICVEIKKSLRPLESYANKINIYRYRAEKILNKCCLLVMVIRDDSKLTEKILTLECIIRRLEQEKSKIRKKIFSDEYKGHLNSAIKGIFNIRDKMVCLEIREIRKILEEDNFFKGLKDSFKPLMIYAYKEDSWIRYKKKYN